MKLLQTNNTLSQIISNVNSLFCSAKKETANAANTSATEEVNSENVADILSAYIASKKTVADASDSNKVSSANITGVLTAYLNSKPSVANVSLN